MEAKTLFEILTSARKYQQQKHGLSENFVEEDINSLANYEFLQELSDAFDEMMATNER